MTIQWNLRPSQLNPAKGWVIGLVGICAFCLGTFAFGGLAMGAAGAAIVFGSCAEYWLGTKYQVDSKGARRQVGVSVTEMTWDKVKRIEVKPNGVLISPLTKDSTLGPFRGVFLQFGKENRDQILEAIRSFGGDYVQGMV